MLKPLVKLKNSVYIIVLSDFIQVIKSLRPQLIKKKS